MGGWRVRCCAWGWHCAVLCGVGQVKHWEGILQHLCAITLHYLVRERRWASKAVGCEQQHLRSIPEIQAKKKSGGRDQRRLRCNWSAVNTADSSVWGRLPSLSFPAWRLKREVCALLKLGMSSSRINTQTHWIRINSMTKPAANIPCIFHTQIKRHSLKCCKRQNILKMYVINCHLSVTYPRKVEMNKKKNIYLLFFFFNLSTNFLPTATLSEAQSLLLQPGVKENALLLGYLMFPKLKC